jgi:hypothetical protein
MTRASLDLGEVIALTERLTELLAEQARAFEAHRPQDVAATLPEVTRLTEAYRAVSTEARAHPELIEAADARARAQLLRVTEAFETVLARQGRALAACKTITEGVVKAIAEEIAARRRVGATYGPGAAKKGAATAITLNRQA